MTEEYLNPFSGIKDKNQTYIEELEWLLSEIQSFLTETTSIRDALSYDSRASIKKNVLALLDHQEHGNASEQEIKDVMGVLTVQWLIARLEKVIKLDSSPEKTFEAPTGPGSKWLSKYSGKKNYQVQTRIMCDTYQFLYSLRRTQRDAQLSSGGKIAARRFEPAKQLAKEIAEERWSSEEPEPRVGEVAEGIRQAINANPSALNLKKAPSLQTIKNWITEIAPEEARRPGRPKEIDNS